MLCLCYAKRLQFVFYLKFCGFVWSTLVNHTCAAISFLERNCLLLERKEKWIAKGEMRCNMGWQIGIWSWAGQRSPQPVGTIEQVIHGHCGITYYVFVFVVLNTFSSDHWDVHSWSPTSTHWQPFRCFSPINGLIWKLPFNRPDIRIVASLRSQLMYLQERVRQITSFCTSHWCSSEGLVKHVFWYVKPW